MNWMIRRVFVIWLTLCMLCTAAIALGHLDHTPNALQRLGFDVCDGDPCFRGVKLGMEWGKVKELFPNISMTGYFAELPNNIGDGINLGFELTGDLKSIDGFGIVTTSQATTDLPIKVQDVISQHGPPCGVMYYTDDFPGSVVLVYPMISVVVDTWKGDYHETRLQWTSTVTSFIITEKDQGYWGTCSDLTNDDFGPWRGFTSVEIYRDRNLRELAATETP
jgi:hypothetical protein